MIPEIITNQLAKDHNLQFERSPISTTTYCYEIYDDLARIGSIVFINNIISTWARFDVKEKRNHTIDLNNPTALEQLDQAIIACACAWFKLTRDPK